MYESSSTAGSAPVLAVENARRRSRLTTLFRLIIAIPWFIVGLLWGIAAFPCAIVAWFALLFTGRYPTALYEFVSSYARFSTRVYAFTWLIADPFPAFDGGEHPDYPVALRLGPPLASYSRLKVLLRIFYIIPAYIVNCIAGIVLYVAGFFSWLVIIITGTQADGLQNLLRWCLGWQVRYLLLFTLLSETYDLQFV